jgi:hypothetical protein
VAAHEARHPIGEGLRAREDRPAVEVAIEVVRECGRAVVSRARVGVDGLGDDRVEVAVKPARAARDALGRPPGEQRSEQQAELEDVGRRGERIAPELLGAGPPGRHQPARRRPVGLAGIEQPGDAEVEQLDPSVRRHQDVRGLEIAVHDQAAMRRGDGLRHLDDESNPPVDREAVGFAKGIDGGAIDELHHQEGAPPLVRAAVEETADVGVLQAREDPALAVEALLRLAVRERQRQHLQGHLLFEGPVVALGEVHRRHPAAGDLPDDAVGAELRAFGDRRLRRVVLRGAERAPRLRHPSAEIDRLIGIVGRAQQPLDVRRQGRIADGDGREKRPPAIRIEVQGLVESLIDCRQSIRRSVEHVWMPPAVYARSREAPTGVLEGRRGDSRDSAQEPANRAIPTQPQPSRPPQRPTGSRARGGIRGRLASI